MAISNVSTYTVLQTTLNDVSKVETDLTNEQEQLSSGNKSQDFTGMSAQVQQYLSLDNVLTKTNQYLTDNQIVETRINGTSTALTQIINAATSLQNLVAQRLTGVSNNAAFGTQINGLWQQIAGQLNTNVDNQYIFSGTKTNTPAVDSTNFPTLQKVGVPDAGYYQGSQQDMTAHPQDSTSVTYNARADAPGFQQLFAGLAMAQLGDSANNTAYLTQAENLVQSGLQGIIGIQATVNSNSAQFSTIDKNLNNQKLYLQGIQQSIGNTDIVAVSTQVAINQGILQAAFQAFAKISGLRLADYLK